jgi:hypothetical protein
MQHRKCSSRTAMTCIGRCEPSLQPGSHHVIITIVIRVTVGFILRTLYTEDEKAVGINLSERWVTQSDYNIATTMR